MSADASAPSTPRSGSARWRWLILLPRDTSRFPWGISWAEGSFALISVAVHVAAVRIAITGEYIVRMYKWFDRTFGIPSPTSGFTRAIIALDQGHFVDAVLYNPIATLAGMFAAVFPFYLVASVLRGVALVPTRRLRRWTTILGLGGMFVAWLIKLRWVPESYW